MSDQLIISAYGSHNAAISMYYKGEYTVVEVERWLNNKNIGLTSYMPCNIPQIVFDDITSWLLAKTDGRDVDVFIRGYLNPELVTPKFKFKHEHRCDHHSAHAAAAFYQSPYEKSLVISFDGGGDGSYFNVYEADRTTGIKLVAKLDNDLGFPYMLLADNLADIRRDPLSIGNLVYAGKLMGLCSYGNVREEWLPHFIEYYRKFKYTGDSYIGGLEARGIAQNQLFSAIGFKDFDIETDRLSGKDSWDVAATTQRAFEEFFLELAMPYLDQYRGWPLCLSGGCALNVLLNARLLEMLDGKVFVPPNVNDCGISVGGILHYLKPRQTVDLTYSGLPIMDACEFGQYVQESSKYFVYENVEVTELAEFISDGNIVGVLQGNSEHGSRALGNRSIICNPIEGMKDTLNEKVKHREWYRPFAPIVRIEEANKYFVFPYNTESRHMTFVATVRDEYKSLLPAITHQDGTARLQTVSRAQNAFIYDLITEFEKFSGHGVILNTSFNVNGKPITTRLSDAFKILDETKLDALYFNNNLIFRKGEERKFKRSPVFSSKKVNDGHCLHLWALRNDPAIIPKLKASLAAKNVQHACLITSDESIALIKANFPDLHVHNIGSNRLYAKHQKTPYNSPLEAYTKIRLLWTKEVLKENHHICQHHSFLDVDYYGETILTGVTQDLIALSNNDEFVVTQKEEPSFALFDKDYVIKKVGSISDFACSGSAFGGSFENVENFSNAYEAVMLWYSNLDKVSYNDADYMVMVASENPHKYRAVNL